MSICLSHAGNLSFGSGRNFGVSPYSGCQTGRPSPSFALRAATTLVPQFLLLRATNIHGYVTTCSLGAVGLRHALTANCLTAYWIRMHLATAVAGFRPTATSSRRLRRRLAVTTGLRFALHDWAEQVDFQSSSTGANPPALAGGRFCFLTTRNLCFLKNLYTIHLIC